MNKPNGLRQAMSSMRSQDIFPATLGMALSLRSMKKRIIRSTMTTINKSPAQTISLNQLMPAIGEWLIQSPRRVDATSPILSIP